MKEEGNAAEVKPKESEPILLIAFTVERRRRRRRKRKSEPTLLIAFDNERIDSFNPDPEGKTEDSLLF